MNFDDIKREARHKGCCTGIVLPLVDALAEAIGERNAAQLIVRTLIRHVDEMAHVTHRAYHEGHPGYFNCPMPYCKNSAGLIKQLENY